MSAELLRKAATILRERGEAVEQRDDWRDYYESDLNPTAGRDDGNWMALMHPGVGLALADWLDAAASNFGQDHLKGLSGCRLCTMKRPNGSGPCPRCIADDLARLIVGDES